MMKFREMSTERKAVVVLGNVLFFGGLLTGLVAPGFIARGVLAGIELTGIAIEVIASCRFGNNEAK